jgi:hyperosmotically inducible periplasmic protein
MTSGSAKSTLAAMVLTILLPLSLAADSKDAWLTTKAKIALLTADGVKVTAVNVDTVNGTVTLHGKVRTEAEKEKAVAAVRQVDGVKDVKNLLQVVPDSVKETVKVADDAVKEKVETSIKADNSLDGVKVASVNNGVVLLSGKAKELDSKLRAIEVAWNIDGVRQVRSEIQVDEK